MGSRGGTLWVGFRELGLAASKFVQGDEDDAIAAL
jgi:hypothetical protein